MLLSIDVEDARQLAWRQQLRCAKRQAEQDSFAKVTDPPNFVFLERAICLAYLGQSEDARRNLRIYLERAQRELSEFPGEDPAACLPAVLLGLTDN